MRFPQVFDENFIITLSLVTLSLSTSVILLFLIHKDFLIAYEEERKLFKIYYLLLTRDYFVFSGTIHILIKISSLNPRYQGFFLVGSKKHTK